MPRYLALEWDRREARLAVANGRGADAQIEQAFSVDLSPRDSNQPLDAEKIGERLAAALAARRIGKTEGLVAVGRASIELRRLTLPPAPEEDLPDMVRFQALKEFTNIGDDWTIDFMLLGRAAEVAAEGDDEASTEVLAAAIAPSLVDQIQQTCESAQVTPRRVVLRPFAAASLLARSGVGADRCRLMVDFLAEEADLTVLLDSSVVFVRTVRLPSTVAAEQRGKSLAGEIRRTIAAAQNQLAGRAVEVVVLFGDGEEHAALRDELESRFALETVIFDPFMGLNVAKELQTQHPEHPGRFAPLLGMLLDEASSRGHAIDFLSPRRRPVPPNRRRLAAIVGGICALFFFIMAGLTYSQLRSLDLRIAQQENASTQLDKPLKALTEIQSQVDEIDQFVAGDVFWLNELQELSSEFPPAEQARVDKLIFSGHNDGGGQIIVEGQARTSAAVPQIESEIADERHTVVGRGAQYDPNEQSYPWRYSENITVAPVESAEGE